MAKERWNFGMLSVSLWGHDEVINWSLKFFSHLRRRLGLAYGARFSETEADALHPRATGENNEQARASKVPMIVQWLNRRAKKSPRFGLPGHWGRDKRRPGLASLRSQLYQVSESAKPNIWWFLPGLQVPPGLPGQKTPGPQKRPRVLGGGRSVLYPGTFVLEPFSLKV